MKQPTYWCVFDADGKPRADTVAYSKAGAREAVLPYWGETNWRKVKRAGNFTIRRVRIVEVEKE